MLLKVGPACEYYCLWYGPDGSSPHMVPRRQKMVCRLLVRKYGSNWYKRVIDCPLDGRIITSMEALICGMRSGRDYYEILGVSPGASADEIKRAYHRSAFQCHPDRNWESEEANEEMERINEAYSVLSDPGRRREYDLPRGYGRMTPKFKRGAKVKVKADSPSAYRGQTGVVDQEPSRDAFRFWYMAKIESGGLTTVRRFAEEELEPSTS